MHFANTTSVGMSEHLKLRAKHEQIYKTGDWYSSLKVPYTYLRQ